MAADWVYGVILILVGTVGDNWGNHLVSLGHKESREATQKELKKIVDDSLLPEDVPRHTEDDISVMEEEVKGRICSFRTLGSTIFILGNLMSFAAYGMGAQSLLAALESIYFVSNLVFAKYIHHEVVTWKMKIATLCICGGNVLVVLFADKAADMTTSLGMIHLYEFNTSYHVYLCIVFAFWCVTQYTHGKYFHSRVHKGVMLWNHTFLEPLCYAISSSIVGTQAVLNSKCMSMLIQTTIRGVKNEFLDWYIYFMLITWILFVAYWLHRLDMGLKLYPPLFIIPVMQVFFMIFAILCGGIYFYEFTGFDAASWAGFVCGIALIVFGVYGLTPKDMVLHTPVTHVKPITSAEESAMTPTAATSSVALSGTGNGSGAQSGAASAVASASAVDYSLALSGSDHTAGDVNANDHEGDIEMGLQVSNCNNSKMKIKPKSVTETAEIAAAATSAATATAGAAQDKAKQLQKEGENELDQLLAPKLKEKPTGTSNSSLPLMQSTPPQARAQQQKSVNSTPENDHTRTASEAAIVVAGADVGSGTTENGNHNSQQSMNKNASHKVLLAPLPVTPLFTATDSPESPSKSGKANRVVVNRSAKVGGGTSGVPNNSNKYDPSTSGENSPAQGQTSSTPSPSLLLEQKGTVRTFVGSEVDEHSSMERRNTSGTPSEQ